MKILVATEKPFAPAAVEGIKKIIVVAGHEFVLLEKYASKQELLEAVADVNAIIIRSDIIDAEVMDAAPNLKIVVRAGAGYDNVDLDNIVGFNTTLNEISGANETPKLAEIDAQTADLALEDINKALKRLDYAESLHKLNTGNKYNV